MTLLVACENIKKYTDTFTMTQKIIDKLYVRDASLAGFVKDEEVTMTDMLYGLILPSGADAAVGLAEKISGSEEAFVELMNKKATELGLTNTHFENTSGLFHNNHYTTAYDMAVILTAAIKNPVCRKILETGQYTSASTVQHPDGIPMRSTLFTYINGDEPKNSVIHGGKTGFVNESGYCLATYGMGKQSGNEYVIITFKNSSRKPAMGGQIKLYSEFVK